MATSNHLYFRISSALKDIIGKDLITDDYIAVFELVKNSYDAYATQVDIYFENIYSENAKIIIKDNGKGMDLDDLNNKWLFVAYSAKKEGSEDDSYDYRNRIHKNRIFAGAKGIGRFSCDRLGKALYLETLKQKKDATTEILITDWEKFESDIKNEFIDIAILHETVNTGIYKIDHGTVLEISNLRNTWDRSKLLKLKDSLAKLINPNRKNGSKDFKIILHVPEELENDKSTSEYYERVNGEVMNFIFDALGLKTTKIETTISEDGEFIETELTDGGTLIYKIIEKNTFNLLNNIQYKLYYLNHSAKMTFAMRMGVASVNYGHVFLYKNGFRIYPYGEPGEDSFGVDVRKSQGYNRFVGTRELMGQIDIYSDNIELKETSSRGDGLIRTNSYEELEECFWEVLKRLEKYVVEVQHWGLSIEEQDGQYGVKSRISDLLAKLTGSDNIIDFKVSDNLFEILEASQLNSVETIAKNLNQIAYERKDDKLIFEAQKVTSKLKEIQAARQAAELQAAEEYKKAVEATKKLKEQISENLFLKSINASDFEEVISLLHHIGIYAGTIDNNLRGISLRIQNNIPLSNDELYDIIKLLSFETKKILNIAAFATKANFKMDTEKIKVNLIEYIREYIKNIIPTTTDKNLKISFTEYSNQPFVREIKPIELNIVIDNIINNAKKAKATILNIETSIENDSLNISFEDNGIGIPEGNIKRIYDLGFTTTNGSGLGLFHVNQIISSMKGKITVENNNEKKGVTFKIKIN